MDASWTIYDLLGLAGVALSLFCYARVQWQRDFAKRLAYSGLNALSAVFLMISLWNNWNFPAFAGNSIWLLLSLYGVYRCSRYMVRERMGAA